MNTKKDFQRAASLVQEVSRADGAKAGEIVRDAFVLYFMRDDSRFDVYRFRLACELPKPARLDADRKAKPRARLVAHAKAGDCIGPGITRAEEYRDDSTGARIPL